MESNGGGGVKVKFIETQFVSSDAASFKSVVQRLTGKSSEMPPLQTSLHRPRARPCSSIAGEQGRPCASGGDQPTTVATERQAASPFEALRAEELNELCDFADLFYATTGGARRDGGSIANGFPY